MNFSNYLIALCNATRRGEHIMLDMFSFEDHRAAVPAGFEQIALTRKEHITVSAEALLKLG
jgi:hypothetical protein